MRILRQKIAAAKPKLYYGTTSEWVFDFPNDLPPGSYTMALDVDRDGTTAPVALATAEPNGKTLIFSLDTYNDACEAAALARKLLYLEVYRNRDTPVVDDRLRILPRTDVEGVPPGQREEYPKRSEVTTMISTAIGALPAPKNNHQDLNGRNEAKQHTIGAIDGLSEKITQIDAALAAGGGGSSFYPPVANYLVNDATYGAVYYLDSTIPSIVFAERVLNLKKIRLRLVSANPAVTGNIVIVPAVDGVDQTPVTLAVGATAATREIEFATAVAGRFSLRRDYAAAADTLDNVTAIVTVIRILEV